jgi:hypothetical protein
VAELGSAFVMGHCGLVGAPIEKGRPPTRSSWLQVLQQPHGDLRGRPARRHGFELILAREMPSLDPAPALRLDG